MLISFLHSTQMRSLIITALTDVLGPNCVTKRKGADHKIISQCDARPKAMRGVAMASVDTFLYPRKQTSGHEFIPCSNDVCHVPKRFRVFKSPIIHLIWTNHRINTMLLGRIAAARDVDGNRDRHCDAINYVTLPSVVRYPEARVSTEHGIKISHHISQYHIIFVNITGILFHNDRRFPTDLFFSWEQLNSCFLKSPDCRQFSPLIYGYLTNGLEGNGGCVWLKYGILW